MSEKEQINHDAEIIYSMLGRLQDYCKARCWCICEDCSGVGHAKGTNDKFRKVAINGMKEAHGGGFVKAYSKRNCQRFGDVLLPILRESTKVTTAKTLLGMWTSGDG